MLPIPKTPIIAELTMIKGDGAVIAVRVYDNPTYWEFYWWFLKVDQPWKVTSRSIRLEEIEAAYNRSSIYKPSDRIANRRFSYLNKTRYLELMTKTLGELSAGIPPLPIALPPRPLASQILTRQDQRNVESFHRRERRKLGLSR